MKRLFVAVALLCFVLSIGHCAISPGVSAPKYGQTKTVAKSGGNYTTIAAALNAITDASASKPYVVIVYPGVSKAYTAKANVKVVFVDHSPVARRLNVSHWTTRDGIGDTVEWTHVSNGRVGFLFESGYLSTWANRHTILTVDDLPVIDMGLDYIQPGSPSAQCTSMYDTTWKASEVMVVGQYRIPTASSATHVYKVKSVSSDAKSGASEPTWNVGSDTTDNHVVWEDAGVIGAYKNGMHGSPWASIITQLEFKNSAGTTIDPAGIGPDDVSITLSISRWVGTGGTSGTERNKLFEFSANQTPGIYLTDTDTDNTVIFRNDKAGAGVPAGTAVLANPGKRRLIGKVVTLDRPQHSWQANSGKIRVWFYIKNLQTGGGVPNLYLMLYPYGQNGSTVAGNLDQCMYKNAGSNGFTTQGDGSPWADNAWNYVEIDAAKFATGTNLLIFDGGSFGANKGFDIGLDTSVTTTVRNKAYLLYQECANTTRIVRSTYKFYRDSDVVEMTPIIPTSGAGTVGGACPIRLCYNLGLETRLFRTMDYQTYPDGFGGRFQRIGKRNWVPNRFTLTKADTTRETFAPDTKTSPLANTAYNFYSTDGVILSRSDDPLKKVKAWFTAGSATRTPDAMGYGRFADMPWWDSSTAPADEINDVIFSIETSGDIATTDVLPKLSVDLSEFWW